MELYYKEVREALLHVYSLYGSVCNRLCNITSFSVVYCHCQCHS